MENSQAMVKKGSQMCADGADDEDVFDRRC